MVGSRLASGRLPGNCGHQKGISPSWCGAGGSPFCATWPLVSSFPRQPQRLLRGLSLRPVIAVLIDQALRLADQVGNERIVRWEAAPCLLRYFDRTRQHAIDG